MPRFSDVFGLRSSQAELDFVDIEVDRDTPLYVDPFAISIRDDEWSSQCQQEILSFFQTALDCIRRQRADRAKELLNGLSEPNETCLGVSRHRPRGRGVSGRQALDLYDALAGSAAARTGHLSDLAESDLFVPGIGRDKLSDITTNIIRRPLISYTQEQCKLHNIPMRRDIASGRIWDAERQTWTDHYVELPVVDAKKLLLVPKFSVRRKLSLESQEFYDHYMLDFLQEDHLARGTALVHVLKNGRRRVYKTELKARHPFTKDHLFQFTREYPAVLARYRSEKARQEPPGSDPLDDNFDEAVFAEVLKRTLLEIQPGSDHATAFHNFMVGALEFIFFPELIYPVKEREINQGRKRIDIYYVNAAKSGFFYRIHNARQIASTRIMVECKNYSSDPANPEIDQLLGRFHVNRGKLGMLICRNIEDRQLLLQRCRDAAAAGQGFVLPLGDADIISMLDRIIGNAHSAIDHMLERLLDELVA